MASITIRNFYDVKTRLRFRAVEHHCSMEEDARLILCATVTEGRASPKNVAKFTQECIAFLGSVKFEFRPRGPMSEPSNFA